MNVSSELRIFIKQELNGSELSLSRAEGIDISKKDFEEADKDNNGTLDFDEIIGDEDIIEAFNKFRNEQIDAEEKEQREEKNKGKRIASYIIDAPGTLVNENSKNKCYYLNPVLTAINGVDEDSSVTMSDAIADPLLSTLTSNMKDKDTAKTIRLILNPVGVGLGRLVSKIFGK